MNQKNFVNMHVLISHSPSCLNRDDMNMQKTAVFGGVPRVRVSSQSLKQAMRTSEYYKNNFEKSTRTRYLIEHLVNKAIASTKDQKRAEQLEKTGLVIAALIEGKTKPDDIKKYKRSDSGRIEHQVVPFHEAEIEEIAKLLSAAVDQAEEKRIDFLKAQLKTLEERHKGKITLDIAVSGRMATSDILYPVDGSVAMAHAITTHAVEPQDIDWFTAVDDLVNDAGEMGAGHLNTQQFSAGVFYRYASLNIRQLQQNLGDVAREKALEVAKHLFHMLVTVVPSAKRQSFAPDNISDFSIVSFGNQPISLANAFEEPVEANKNGGYLKPSVLKMANYWGRMNQAYALGESAVAFDPDANAKYERLPTLHSLAEVETWISADEKTSLPREY
jgi:CRISPR system Cascade subunit CasC